MAKLLLISLQKSGAAPRDALEFSNALCELKTRHEIVIAKGNELLPNYTVNDYRKVRIIPTFSSPTSFLLSTLTLIRPLRFFVHLSSYIFHHSSSIIFSTHFHPWLVLIPIARFFRPLRWYHAVHENPFDPKEVSSRLQRWFERTVFNHADRIVCYSEYMRSELLPYYYQLTAYNQKPPLVSLPLGAYDSMLVGLKKNERKNDAVHFGCLGRIEPYKDLETLIGAWEQVRAQIPDAELRISGRGIIREELRIRAEKLGIIINNRWLTTNEMTTEAQACDVIVLPYLVATQSGVISLALAFGKPVIATRVGGLPEQIDEGKTGYTVQDRNPDALARAMITLGTNKDLRDQMSLNARALGSSRLSWKRAAEIFLANLLENSQKGDRL